MGSWGIAGSSAPCSVLCDDLEGWDRGWEAQDGGTYVYMQLIHTAVQQQPTQHCGVIIFQLKIKDENFKKSVNISKAHKRMSGTRQGVCLSLLAQKYYYKLRDLFKVMC